MFADEVFDEVHFFGDNFLINARVLELSEKRGPRRVDTFRGEALFGIVAHMCDVDEGASSWP